jgi:hypothetical protein
MINSTPQDNFEKDLDSVLANVKAFLMKKNVAYGDSALNPIRIFSKANSVETILVRIDDKLSRLFRGCAYEGDNDEYDLFGYFCLLAIARLREARTEHEK